MAETLAPFVAHLQAGAYTSAAGVTILLYDILLTTKDEIRLIWPSDFSLVKCLYLANRYLPVPCLILGTFPLANLRAPLSTNLCKLVALTQIIGQAISLVGATWLLVIRVVALHSGKKIIAIPLYFIFISTHMTGIVLSAIVIKEFWGTLAYVDFIATTNPSHLLGIAHFAPVICEFALVGLQLFHAYQHTRRLNTLRPTTPLLRTLYADGFAYFMVVVSLRVWSGFIFTTADVSYWYLSIYLELALISTSVSRLVLHLRRAAEIRPQAMLTSTGIPLSHLAQNANGNINNANPHRNSKFYVKQNRNSQPPRRNHSLSSFQNAAETIYTYPAEISQLRVQHLREMESITSVEHGASAKGVDGSRSLLTITDVERGCDHGSYMCDLCCDGFDGDRVVEASKRAGEDDPDVDPLPASPITWRKREESMPPPGMVDMEGRVCV